MIELFLEKIKKISNTEKIHPYKKKIKNYFSKNFIFLSTCQQEHTCYL